MDYETIKNASGTAQVIHKILLKRKRNRKVLNLKLLAYNINMNGGSITTQDFENYFKALEQMGVGEAKRAQDGSLTFFTFKKPMLEVIGKQKAPENVVSIKRGRPHKVHAPVSAVKTILLGLRTGLDIRFDLPHDLTKDEAERISQLLKKVAG